MCPSLSNLFSNWHRARPASCGSGPLMCRQFHVAGYRMLGREGGDAAHTFPPTGGQGVAMTVEDGDGLGYYSWTAIEVRHCRGSA